MENQSKILEIEQMKKYTKESYDVADLMAEFAMSFFRQ